MRSPPPPAEDSFSSYKASPKKPTMQHNQPPLFLTRTNLTSFQSKVKKQRNRLEHAEDVSINDSLACLQDIHSYSHHGILPTCSYASRPTEGAVKCIAESSCVLKHLSTLPNKKAKAKIVLEHPSRNENVVHRLMVSSPKDLVG